VEMAGVAPACRSLIKTILQA